MTDPLFNYQEMKQLNDNTKMVAKLSREIALLKLEINNIKNDIKKERIMRFNNGL
jgi:hypothetical protein